MKLHRIAEQLKREVQSSPLKAGVLGVLLLFGLYSWTPLVLGWLAPEKDSVAKTKRASKKEPQSIAKSRSTTPTLDKQKDKKRWQDVVEAIAQDQRSMSARYLPAMRNPFALSAEETALALKPQSSIEDVQAGESHSNRLSGKPVIAANQTPKQLGIELKGTIIGRNRRIALFDDQVISEGGRLIVRLNKSLTATFIVQKVDADSVQLIRKKETYLLRLPQNPLAERLAEARATIDAKPFATER